MNLLKRIHWKYVFIGLAVDVFGSVLSAYLIIWLWARPQEYTGSLYQLDESFVSSTPFFLLLLVNGFIFSFLGAFLAAWLAGHDEIEHAVAQTALSIVSEMAFHYMPPHIRLPEWYNMDGLVLTLPICFAAGWIAQLIRQKNSV